VKKKQTPTDTAIDTFMNTKVDIKTDTATDMDTDTNTDINTDTDTDINTDIDMDAETQTQKNIRRHRIDATSMYQVLSWQGLRRHPITQEVCNSL
jgi:hypothetical protein